MMTTTPAKKSGRPATGITPRVNIQLRPPFGRFSKAALTHDPELVEGLREMMRRLNATGRDDVLRHLVDGDVTMMQLYEGWRAGDVSETLRKLLTPTPKVVRVDPLDALLKPAFDEWIAVYDGVGDMSRETYRCSMKLLLRVGQGYETVATIADLPWLLRDYKIQCQSNQTPRAFNICRNTCRSFIRQTIGRRSDIYADVVDVEGMNDQPKREGNILMPAELQALCSALAPAYAANLWTLATTGMEIGIYLSGKYDVLADRVQIKGKKMKRLDDRRNRAVPLILPVTAPVYLKKEAFRYHLRKPSNNTLQPYDLRRCYAAWLYHAGIPETRIEIYMGHKSTSMTRRYAKEAVDNYFVADAAKVRQWIESELAKVQPAKKKRS